MRIYLSREWEIGEPIEKGGFGEVYAASSDLTPSAVAKLVPKVTGADRELLFVDLVGVRNVMPILDSGETATHWVLIMPRADKSLRQHIQQSGGRVVSRDAVTILSDIAAALADLDGRVVHRDLKPENVLLLDGMWVLADFGISRYADATTSMNTRKYALTAAYAAPERWRSQRATSAADVYSLGVIAYELVDGSRPFAGPAVEDFREQHLHQQPAPLVGGSTALATLIEECLYKAPEARPTPQSIETRLTRIAGAVARPGLSKLQEANRAEASRRAEEVRRISEMQSESERRTALLDVARAELTKVAQELKGIVIEAAPSVQLQKRAKEFWTIVLNQASLILSAPVGTAFPSTIPRAVRLQVIASSAIGIKIPPDEFGYEGRSHSLWYCDAHEVNHFAWFETAFMLTPGMPRISLSAPFALDPGPESARAITGGMADYQVAWPFTPLSPGELDEFVDRWGSWFADAAQGQLHRPSLMPERTVEGSWRKV
jgi:serine/threonine-protein kinase